MTQLRRMRGGLRARRCWQIAQETGIDAGGLCPDSSRASGAFRWIVLDKLGEYLGLRIVADKPRTKKGR